jgi:hypothetical protein
MAVEYISYSRLSTLDKGLFLFKNKYIDGIHEERESKALTLGDAVDVLLTTPDDFYNKFIVSTIVKPTGQMGDYVDYLFKFLQEDDCELRAYEAVGFKRDTLDKVKERFKTEAQDYFNFLVESKNKSVISFEEYTKAQNISNSFKNGKYTSFLFEETLGIERHWQYEFDLDIPFIGYRCKGKLDNVDINHEEKTIKIRDIKTTGVSILGFSQEVFQWRYDIQAVIYILALEKLFPEYIITMEYVVESTNYPNIPVIYEFPLYLLSVHMKEDYVIIGNRKYKTVKKLMEELRYYEENGYDEYYESAVNCGKFKIEC